MQLSSKLRKWSDPSTGQEGLLYYCQGCQSSHSIRIVGDGSWGWNGDVEKPVFTPSVLSTTGHHISGQPQPPDCYICNERAAHPEEHQTGGYRCTICHTFVGCNGAQPGEVIFLGDCTHELAGTVQPFPDLPEWMRDKNAEANS